MVSALFQPEISSLESQVAALQAQIAQAQQRITALGEVEFEADGALQALTSAVEKVSALAPDAIAKLKLAVFALFNSGDDGNQPITLDPQPQPDLGDSGLDGSSSPSAEPDYCLLEDCPPESLQGQSVEVACLLEDCPAESLLGQSVKIACLLGHHDILCEGEVLEAPAGYQYKGSDDRGLPKSMVAVEEPAYVDLVKVSETVAYMRHLDGEVISVYAGGSNKGKLRNWGDWLTRTHSVTHAYEIREGKRLGTKWEIKLTSMSLFQIERLAACDFSKDPRSNYPEAPKRPVERVPSMLEIEGIGVGDTVRSITVKNWQYKVTGIDSDNFLVCDRIGANPPISQTLHPGSVELVTKADIVDIAAQELEQYLEQRAVEIAPTPTIDPTDVPRGVVLRQTNDDILIEYLVYAWVIVRNQGRPEAQQKQIGRLVEGLGIIEAYKPVSGRHKAFSSTMDAVNFLINTSDYRQSDIDAGVALFESRQQQVLVGAGSTTQQLEEVEF